MNSGRIYRGPMAADNFTQISNALFRDPRLSAKAKGIFGFISTHKSGWGVTPESIAAAMKDGVSAIKAGLQELETFGYLIRRQKRRSDGTLGPISYLITDIPSSEPVVDSHPPVVTCEDAPGGPAEGDSCRSQPVDENPLAADPPAVDRPHKKTNSKDTKEKKTTSPSGPSVKLVPDLVADQGGGGGDDAPQQEKQDSAAAAFVDRLPFGSRIPGPRQRAHLVSRVSAALAAGWEEWSLRVQLTEETESAKSLAAVYRHRLDPENLPAAPPLPKPRKAADDSMSVPAGSMYVKCLGATCGHRKMLPTADGLCRDCREDVTA